MKVKELIEQLKEMNEDAYIHIQTDKRFEEDIKSIRQYETENAEVVLLSNRFK